jgi:hypothetical protein
MKAWLGLLAVLILAPGCKHESNAGQGNSTSITELPKEFPSAVKLYPGATVLKNDLGTGVNGKPARTVEIATKDDFEKLRAFYAPANVKGIKYNSGDGSPGHPAWFTDTQRFIDVRVTMWKEGADAKATLIANLM